MQIPDLQVDCIRQQSNMDIVLIPLKSKYNFQTKWIEFNTIQILIILIMATFCIKSEFPLTCVARE